MRVVILGGGYTAIWCYRALQRWTGSSVEVTVVAPTSQHVFHGFTGEVLDGGLAPALQNSDLERCMPRARRLLGTAVAVDPVRRTVQVEQAGATTELEYDELVVATGAQDRTAAVPGLAQHGWSLRHPGQVQLLLDHLSELETTPAEDDRDAARRGTVVVAGAGFAGTEVAAALARRYGGTRRIVLVASGTGVVPAWQQRSTLQRRLLQNLDEAGVELLTGRRVVSVDEDGVVLDDGARLEAATTVSALGNSVPGMPGLEAFQEPDGLLRVDDRLRVTEGVWSAGDAAAVRSRGRRAPKEALWAIRAGTTVGRNIARAARGAAPRRFGFRGLGTVAAFAPGRAVATIWGVALPQPVGWAVRAAVFLWFVPSRRGAVDILRWSLRRRETVLPAPVPVAVRAPRVLVGLDGGRAASSGRRPAVDDRPQPRTAESA